MKSSVVSRILIWCHVCKDWISAWPEADYCPRCGNDEIEKDA